MQRDSKKACTAQEYNNHPPPGGVFACVCLCVPVTVTLCVLMCVSFPCTEC